MIEFIGRSYEIAHIRDAITATQQKIVVISGPSGIGKTRLLQEIRVFAGKLSRVRVLDIIDFDVPAYHIPQIIGRKIARQFRSGTFDSYIEALYLRQAAEEARFDPSQLTEERRDISGQFIRCFNNASAHERIVLLFDTVEKMQGRLNTDFMLGVGLQLQNVVLVFAGRSADDAQQGAMEHFLHELERVGGTESITHLPLGPFDLATSRTYVDRKQDTVGLLLDSSWSTTLAVLAGGRPVLIDLAVEMGNHIPAANWLRDQDPVKLSALQQSESAADRDELTAIRSQFERNLVADIINIRNEIDQLTILLAIAAPLNVQAIATALTIPLERARVLFEDAAQRVSFKIIDDALVMLHDAVRDLVVRYVLPKVDPDGEASRTYSKRIISTLEEQSQEYLARIKKHYNQSLAGDSMSRFERQLSDERDYQQARLQLVDLTFRLDPVAGVQYLTQEVANANQQGSNPADIGALFGVAQAHLPRLMELSLEYYVQLKIMLASQCYTASRFEEAHRHFEDVAANVPEGTPLRFEMLDVYGGVEMGVGSVQGAYTHFVQALNLARELQEDSLIVRALLSCGWATRALGQLEHAVAYYQEALRLTMKTDYKGDDASIRRATALNGLSYVYAIQMNRRKAIESLNQAIAIRKSLGEGGRYMLAQSYSTAGEVYNELEQPEKAITYLDLAENMFTELMSGSIATDNNTTQRYNQWLAKIYSARGRAYEALTDLGTASDRDRYLPLIEEQLIKAVHLSMDADKPRALQRLGFLYSCYPEQRPLAVKAWQDGHQAAKKFGDIFMEFNCVCQLAYMAVYGLDTGFADYQAFASWYDTYRQRNGTAFFKILDARFSVYLGCLALQAHEVERAYTYFHHGLGELEHEERQATYSFGWQLRFLQTDVWPTCDPEEWRLLWGRLLEEWMAQGKGDEAWTTFERWKN